MKKLIALSSALLASSGVLAAVTNGTALSEAKVESSAWEDFKERSSLTYFSEFNDGSVRETVNQNYYYQLVSGRYKLNDTWTARADMRFQTSEGVKDKYQELDPRLGIQGVSYASGNFSVFTLLRLEMAATTASKDVNKLARPRIYNALSYSAGAHSFSTGLEISKWLYEQGKENAASDSDITQMNGFIDVTYRYTVNDTAAFQTYTELGYASRFGKPAGDVIRNWERHLVGMDLNFSKYVKGIVSRLTFYPHLDYRPGDDREAGDLGVGAWISAAFFR